MTCSTTLTAARALLSDVTPLKSDCGRLCGGACCQPSTEETQGMLLFPGEEALYAGLDGYRVLDCAEGKLLICAGHCRREERPLSCRIFRCCRFCGRTGFTWSWIGGDGRCAP